MYLVVDKGNLLFCYFCSVPMRQLNFHSFGLWSPWLPYCFASHFQIESLMQVSNSYFIKELKLFKFAWGFPLFSSFFSAVLLPDNSLLWRKLFFPAFSGGFIVLLNRCCFCSSGPSEFQLDLLLCLLFSRIAF